MHALHSNAHFIAFRWSIFERKIARLKIERSILEQLFTCAFTAIDNSFSKNDWQTIAYFYELKWNLNVAILKLFFFVPCKNWFHIRSTLIHNIPLLFFFFSHYGPFHLAFNMYALQSFAPPLVDIMGKEHFLAIYLSGAVVSSMSSYVYKVSQSVKKSEK